jgi:hypothetical protein
VIDLTTLRSQAINSGSGQARVKAITDVLIVQHEGVIDGLTEVNERARERGDDLIANESAKSIRDHRAAIAELRAKPLK